jgi:hypothetical protein
MAATLPQRRRRRRHLPGLLGNASLRPADHVARLHRVASNERGADAPTLDDLIVEAWERVSLSKTVACPVCGGEMEQRGAVPTTRVDASGSDDPCGTGAPCGECGDCGARLS